MGGITNETGACGRILHGPAERLPGLVQAFERQAVDLEWMPETGPARRFQTTLARPASVTGPGTFLGKAQRTLNFVPSNTEGWWFDRTDQAEAMPIPVSARSVWTTARNIVLATGSPHNYMRMVEHIIALRLGLGIDNLSIRMDSGDPPLFDGGSLDLVEALNGAGCVEVDRPVRYVTVREPVTVVGENGSFLCLQPCTAPVPSLTMDCAVHFPTAIGKQRIRVRVTPETCRHGAEARTNCSLTQVLFARTIGLLFADFRNMGYTRRNILIAGRHRYVNAPRLLHEGKSLEAVWHRAIMDLLAALALIDTGRFVGHVLSYRAGHTLDVIMVRKLYEHQLLTPVPPA